MIVDKAISKKRQEICNGCEYRKKLLNRCSVCGCFLSFKTKLLSAECPVGKWKSPMKSWGAGR